MTLQPLNRQTADAPLVHPERVVQFGGGNFLRAFVDWMIDILNERTDFNSSVALVKATSGTYPDLDTQEGLFHVRLQGIQNGDDTTQNRLVKCVSRTVYPYSDHAAFLSLARQPEIRFIVSNTTEAGIQYDDADRADDTPPNSFPGKLTQFLHTRYQAFGGDPARGCVILPTELVPSNGNQLREMVLRYAAQWNLAAGFTAWIEQHNRFCNTLVDRIVSGYPDDADAILNKLGYQDALLAVGEPYHSWIIEGDAALREELPFEAAGLNVKIVPDATPDRQTKVRLLNGAHTAMVPLGYLLGLETVRESVEHPMLGKFLRDLLYREVIPSLDLPPDDLNVFAATTLDRFRNPYLQHRLLSIAVNSTSKYRERLLPTLIAYHARMDKLPRRVVLALSALLRFYAGEWQGQSIPLKDDPDAIAAIQRVWQQPERVKRILSDETLWGQDLTTISGLVQQVEADLESIHTHGLARTLERVNDQ